MCHADIIIQAVIDKLDEEGKRRLNTLHLLGNNPIITFPLEVNLL